MEEELMKKIDEMKKDTSSYKKYIKSLCDSEKAKELFANNDDFKELQNKSDEKKSQKEDEYF